MAIPERDTVYSNDGLNRTTYTRSSSGTGWFVGIIVALALLAIAYLVFAANSTPSTVDVNTPVTVETPVTDPAMAPSPMTEAPATDINTAPMTEAPAVEAPAVETPAPAPVAPVAPPAAPVTP